MMTARWPSLGIKAFRRLLFTRFSTTAAVNAQAVALGWQIYSVTRSPVDLALIGLIQFTPAALLIMVTGTVADRFPRRSIMTVCLIVMALASGLILAATLMGTREVWPYFVILGVFATARAFLNPAQQSLVPNVVPAQHLSNAVATNSVATRTAQALGPVAGGTLYAIAPGFAFGGVCLVLAIAAILSSSIPATNQRIAANRITLESLMAGFRYIWKTPPILGGVTLDIFVIVLGSVTALLPMLAYEVLDAGPQGLGLLRAAPALGGICAAVYFSLFSVRGRMGVVMLSMVAVFGFATIVVGLSTTLWVSLIALTVMGASDMASVYIRWTLIQLWTPDEVRGRVAAVTGAAAMGSNDLGDFRAGLVAAFFGAGPSIILGGVTTLIVVALWTRWFPQLARVQSFDQPELEPVSTRSP